MSKGMHMWKKNDVIELEITGISSEGSGVARAGQDGGLVIFVPYTAVGDRALVRILKVEKTHAFGRVEQLITPSPDRVGGGEPDCAAFGRCGGCVYRHITYEAECRYKWQKVADAFQRIGGLAVTPQPLVACGRADRYRNKAQYPVAAGPYRPLIGFYAPRSHRVVEQRDCLLQPPVFRQILDVVARYVKETGLSVYDEQTHTGVLRHIYIRQAPATGEIMVCLVCTSGKLPQPRRLIERLQAVPEVVSLVVNLQKGDTNVILGEEEYTLWGRDSITDRLCGLQFRLSPRSFYQVNSPAAERLYTLAAEQAQLRPQDVLLDLYCGTGTIGLSMAHRVRQVIGVEIVEPAVRDAMRNAAENGVTNARFLCADAAAAAETLRREGIRPDVVVVDPPRKGLDAALPDLLRQMGPRTILYISCDPATLARDCARLQPCGYTVTQATPVDLFPRTAHVECVTMMTRN
ncbi:MAG: 23S rRNA (uracil(1939)-C(5))-methyltransferase RlmD [Clostridia bacterium]|nr:23S rRNA (uracil(1939)-C(5))-methyltransferase RlmD [Clostridia bacterium]